MFAEASRALPPRLRGTRLRPFANLLNELIASDSYAESTPQMSLTLQHAPDRVDDLVEVRTAVPSGAWQGRWRHPDRSSP